LGSASRRISSEVLVMTSGSRNSSTNFMPNPLVASLSYSRRLRVPGIFQSVTLNFLHGGFRFSEHPQRAHLVDGIFFADLAHGKTNMDEDPVSLHRQVVLQKPQINLAPDAHNVDEGGGRLVSKKLNDLSGYG
jgi:hypothetical protein